MNFAFPMEESDGKQQRALSADTGSILALERVDVRLEVEGQAVHISLEQDSESRFRCPKCDREYGYYDYAPGRTWRHLNICQFQTLVHARVPRVNCEEHGVVQVQVPWAEPHGRFTILMERFVIDVLLACQTA